MIRRLCLAGVLAVAVSCAAPAQAQPADWLDRPLQPWNRPGAALPKTDGPAAERAAAQARCQLQAASGAAANAVAAAGWLPLLHLDRELVEADTEVLLGVTDLDGMCRPMGFHLFVFAGGRFAGTLSPSAMSSRADGSAGPVRFAGDGLSVEFARFKEGDALCCPSARVAVRYRIDRSSGAPVVVPVEVRTTRSY